MMIKYILLLLLLFSSSLLPQEMRNDFSIEFSPGYPKWLSVDGKHTDQTSGIAFIGEGNFLLADDTGFLHRLTITDDTVFTLHSISFSKEVDEFLADFPKKDFEEILYDKHTGRILISIEGNHPKIKSTAGIYEVSFFNDDLLSDSVVSIKKLMITPEEEFLKHVDNNIGFEGLAADSRYYYAALEGFREGFLFADSTLIYVIDKSDLTIKKILSTRSAGIATICGLYSDEELSLYGIDRNNRNLFHLKLSDGLDIISVSLEKIPAAIPNYNSFDYVSAFESLTFDNENRLYIVDDPWKTFYIPPPDILSQLDEETIRMFRAYVPVIYKFNLIRR